MYVYVYAYVCIQYVNINREINTYMYVYICDGDDGGDDHVKYARIIVNAYVPPVLYVYV